MKGELGRQRVMKGIFIGCMECGPKFHWSSKEPTNGHQRACSAP